MPDETRAKQSPNRRFAECVAVVLAHEGGFVDHPQDPGGATNMGITLRTLREWRSDDTLGPEALRDLSETEAREIYFARYWNPIRADELPPGVDLAVFDWAVHGGVRRAARDLQAALNVRVDGAIGRQTLEAARRADPAAVVRGVCARRLTHLQTRPHWATFGRGWERRVRAVEKAALARTRKPALTVREAQQTSTVRTATGMAAVVAPVAAGLQSVVSAFASMDRWLGLGLIAAGLVALVVAAWVITTWLRTRHA